MPFQIDDYFSPTTKAVEKEEAETSQVNGAKKNEVMVVERKEKDAAAAAAAGGMKLQSIIEKEMNCRRIVLSEDRHGFTDSPRSILPLSGITLMKYSKLGLNLILGYDVFSIAMKAQS